MGKKKQEIIAIAEELKEEFNLKGIIVEYNQRRSEYYIRDIETNIIVGIVPGNKEGDSNE